MRRFLYMMLLMFSVITSCEQTIELDLPEAEPKIVVDAYIETGLPPYVLLSRTSGYFDPVSSTSIINDAISGAIVFVSDETDTVQLHELTINGVVQKGLYVALDTVTYAFMMTGIPGRTYQLFITTPDGKQVSSSAKLQQPVPLDSVWFQLVDGNDSLGLAYGRLNEPDTLGNCYRWLAKRIGKDDVFIAPLGAVFDDRFVNNLEFDLFYNRGSIQNSQAVDDNNEEAGLFKRGDTIVVKFAAIDRGVYEFWRDAEQQISNNGSPFAVPSNIKSNIIGGIGLFATYAPAYDTIIAP
jgi:hypothetical protein